MNKKPIIRLTIAGLVTAAVLTGGVAYAASFQNPEPTKTSAISEPIEPSETTSPTPTPEPTVEPVVEPAPVAEAPVEPVAPAPAPVTAPAPVVEAPAPAPEPDPIRCPAGSTANSNDGVNDTSCYPDICFTIAVPDPVHPECDEAFKP